MTPLQPSPLPGPVQAAASPKSDVKGAGSRHVLTSDAVQGAGGLQPARPSTSWPFDHPRRGTCEIGCRLYGLCHCECGQETNVAKWNRNYDDGTRDLRGEPRIFRSGHKPAAWRSAGCMSRNGVPRAQMLPHFEEACRRVGGPYKLALRLGVPEGTIYSNIHHARAGRGKCDPMLARRVLLVAFGHDPDAVLYRPKRDGFGTYDIETPRAPTDWERERAELYATEEYRRLRDSRRYALNADLRVPALDAKVRNRIARRHLRAQRKEAS